jgi:hypothetical protein
MNGVEKCLHFCLRALLICRLDSRLESVNSPQETPPTWDLGGG